jgi:hypothetical protein
LKRGVLFISTNGLDKSIVYDFYIADMDKLWHIIELSDKFEERQGELRADADDVEDNDAYTEVNVFFVPVKHRQHLRLWTGQ